MSPSPWKFENFMVLLLIWSRTEKLGRVCLMSLSLVMLVVFLGYLILIHMDPSALEVDHEAL